MKSMIVAYDQNHGIGRNGVMPWGGDLPADLKHFKELTLGKAVVMGRKTFEAIGRPLPGRQNIVVSRHDLDITGVETYPSLAKAYDAAESEEVMVIGGGQIYTAALEDAERIYATEIEATFDSMDAFFPEIDQKKWRETARERHEPDERNCYSYSFVTYSREV